MTGSGDRLDRLLAQLGERYRRAAMTDALTHFKLDALRHILAVVEQALREDDYPEPGIERIMAKILYGGLPDPLEAELRQEMMRESVEQLKRMGPPR